ncbi:unnamed protein product [Cuscuta epithymum]|uniref:Uncharacterized protein n=1 Tax=Cuscuta epithymum TaxID=186058 RepID=A0AAV0E5T8_9ASTE|nr:unnamed protein product [Cuscuta epithymum]
MTSQHILPLPLSIIPYHLLHHPGVKLRFPVSPEMADNRPPLSLSSSSYRSRSYGREAFLVPALLAFATSTLIAFHIAFTSQLHSIIIHPKQTRLRVKSPAGEFSEAGGRRSMNFSSSSAAVLPDYSPRVSTPASQRSPVDGSGRSLGAFPAASSSVPAKTFVGQFRW